MGMTRALLIAGLAAGLAACGDNDGNEAAAANGAATANGSAEARGTIGDTLAQAGDHSSFMAAIAASGMTETLQGAGPYTVFAPGNAAFAGLPEEARTRLTAADNRARLSELLRYHIVAGTVTAEDLGRAIDRGPGGRAELATLAGGNLSISRDGDAIVIGDGAGARARVTRADQLQANGVVHTIDAVLMPAD